MYSPFYYFSKINVTSLSTFQLPRRTLTISLYPFSPLPLSLSILRCYKAPSAAATVSNALCRPEVGGLFPRKETGHLLFPYSDMKRHFYFCRPPRTASDRRARVAAISTVFKTLSRGYQCHVREHDRFTGPEFEATYNMDIAHTFKESVPSLSASLPATRRPSFVFLF